MNTSLSQFNQTARLFLEDLKHIFGGDDADILTGEVFMNVTRVNARAIITPFYKTVVQNSDFMKNIVLENTQYFVDYTKYTDLMDESNGYLVNKFKEAVVQRQDDAPTLKTIFNWFKLLVYHALVDKGIDAAKHMQTCAKT